MDPALAHILLWAMMLPCIVACCIAAIRLFTPLRPLTREGEFHLLLVGAARNRRPLLVLMALLVIFFAVSLSEGYYVDRVGADLTPQMHSFEGLGGIKAVQSMENAPLTILLAVIYIFGFIFVLVLHPVLLTWTGHDTELRRYVHSVLWLTAIALPIFILVHVTVTSLYSNEVRPLLYSNRTLMELAGAGGFYNAFPSSHVYMTSAVSLSALRLRGRHRRYFLFTLALLALTALATVYLGVHWITDVACGWGLAFGVHLMTSSSWYDRLI